MQGQELLLHKLNESLVALQAKNSSFSLRAFAKKLGVTISTVSEIRSGKRTITKKLASKISDHLFLTPEEKERVLSAIPHLSSKQPVRVARKEYLQLSTDQFRAVGEWQHFAILALMKSKDFKNSPAWIARRLSISVASVEQALTRLKRLELVSEGKNGILKRTSHSVSSTDEVVNLAVRKSHLDDLELIKDKLAHIGLEKRDSTSITMAIDPKKIPEAKKVIREFRDRLSSLLETGEKTEVYKMSLHLFPLTDTESRT